MRRETYVFHRCSRAFKHTYAQAYSVCYSQHADIDRERHVAIVLLYHHLKINGNKQSCIYVKPVCDLLVTTCLFGLDVFNQSFIL